MMDIHHHRHFAALTPRYDNRIDFGKFAGDWGYMFIKSIEVVAE